MKRTITGLLIIQALSGTAWAQSGQPAETQQEPSKEQAPSAPASSSEIRVTYSFKDADLVYVLRLLANDLGAQLGLNSDVAGTVTLELVDVPIEEAIRRVLALQPQGYSYKIIRTASASVFLVMPQFAISTQFNEYAVGQSISRSPQGTVNLDPLAVPSSPANVPVAINGVGYNGGASPYVDPGAESYRPMAETGYREVSREPLSTFSIDVDTASYANVRRFLNGGNLPPVDAVRVEEMLNYFRYDYPQPTGREPFSVTTELSECPWNNQHQLLRVGLQGRRTESKKMPPRNLVFLLDVSGSMDSPDKLPLVKKSMQMLLATLGHSDHVAIVVYAGNEGMALPSTSCDEKSLIGKRIESLSPDGSTNGSAGIQLAYQVARENFKKGAINRVILCTDGDFNVGLTGGALDSLIAKEREDGVFLTVLGFGTGNLKDDTMESLADKGNGNYAYIDGLLEAQKVLVRESGSTLETIAKDVKLQIEFNPRRVSSYRLIGYENRRLQNEDFSNDKKDAGELGSGHNVTALYELVTGKASPSSTDLRYQGDAPLTEKANGEELALVKLRYKDPTGHKSKLLEMPISNRSVPFAKASGDLRFAASVAGFGMVLRDSEFKGETSLEAVQEWASSSLGQDPDGDRHEFLKLVELASALRAAADGTD